MKHNNKQQDLIKARAVTEINRMEDEISRLQKEIVSLCSIVSNDTMDEGEKQILIQRYNLDGNNDDGYTRG